MARWARRRSKALNKYFLGILNIFFKNSNKAKVSSKVKIVNFRLIGFRDGTNNSWELKIRQKATQAMKKVAYSYGFYTDQGQGQVK